MFLKNAQCYIFKSLNATCKEDYGESVMNL
jgi:hypothetical protein